MSNAVKEINVKDKSSVTILYDVGAEAQNVDVSFDVDGHIIEDITVIDKDSTKSTATVLKDIENNLNDVADNNHASSLDTYGAADNSNYGHIKLGNGFNINSETGATNINYGDESSSACEGNDVRLNNKRISPNKLSFDNGTNIIDYDGSNEINIDCELMKIAFINHASDADIYGLGDENNYGHFKIVNLNSKIEDNSAAASAQDFYDKLQNKCDNFNFNTDTNVLSLRSGSNVLSTATINFIEGKTKLIVTVDDDILYNKTITCEKRGDETLSSIVDNTGTATFNLSYEGTYTISCENYGVSITNPFVGGILNANLHVGICNLTVNTISSNWFSANVVVTKNDVEVVSGNMVNGSIVFKLYETGTYVVTINNKKSNTITFNNLDSSQKITINDVELVSWSAGTDEQIKSMIDAYYAGDITLAQIKNVWAEGDERNVNLTIMSNIGVGEPHRAQTVKMRIIDFDHDLLVSPINSKTKALITIQQKDCLMDAECEAGSRYGENNTENGYINYNRDNSTGWDSCNRRTWCNNVYYNAFPSNFKNMIKLVKKSTASTGNTSSPAWWINHDYCFLPSAWEISGNANTTAETGLNVEHIDKDAEDANVMMPAGGTQYNIYYTLGVIENRKMPKWNSSSYSNYWWLRSPAKDNDTSFCSVQGDGNIGNDYANLNNGLAPVCCL